jgi:hypothetical protein
MLSVAALGCGQTERLDPLYTPQAIQLSDTIPTEVSADIPTTVIHPSAVKRFTQMIFGWLPILSDLIALPVDFAPMLLPALKAVVHPNLPGETPLNDPEFLKEIATLKIQSGYLRVIPESERAPEPKHQTCWFRHCSEIGFSFLKEVRIRITFADSALALAPHHKQKSSDSTASSSAPEGGQSVTVDVGAATTAADYDKVHQMLNFHMSEIDLKPYFEKFSNYRIDLISRGWLPKRDVYIGGSFVIAADVLLPK